MAAVADGKKMSALDFSGVTEIPGGRATAEQMSMMLTRYHLAAERSRDKNVLEVGCGAGTGLGYLARVARRVVGGDIEDANLAHAREHYRDNAKVHLVRFDAQVSPFPPASFDTILLYEVVYYLPDAAKFAAEARRVLRPGGTLLVSTVNREWEGFNPSPHSVCYYSGKELSELLRAAGFSVRLFVGFKAESRSFLRRLTGALRRVAVRWHLIPKTMKGKELLKRLFCGRLTAIGHELEEGAGRFAPLVEPPDIGPIPGFKVLYAVATREA